MAKLQYSTISKRTVEALSVEKDTVFWDRELTGFGVRVYPTGGRVYVAQSRGPEGAKRVTVGRHGVISRRPGAAAGSSYHCSDQGRRGTCPRTHGAAERADGGRACCAVSGGACGGPVQARDGGAVPTGGRQIHLARVRQGAAYGGGARACHRLASQAERCARHGKPCDRHAVPDVQSGRGLGACFGRRQPVPVRA